MSLRCQPPLPNVAPKYGNSYQRKYVFYLVFSFSVVQIYIRILKFEISAEDLIDQLNQQFKCNAHSNS